MLKSQLIPVELSGCVVTTFLTLQDSDKLSGTFIRSTDSYSGEKKNASFYHNASKTECDGRWSCSGVILDRNVGIVLCHGAIFFPFLKKEFSKTDQNLLLADDFLMDLTIQVECPSEPRGHAKTDDVFNNVVLDKRPGLGLVPMSNQVGLQTGHRLHQAHLLMLVPSPEFHTAFSRLFDKTEGWVFSSEEEKHEYCELQKDLAYLHWFAVLKLQSPLTSGTGKMSYMEAAKLVKGSAVFTCGSPFGSFYPDIFLNTISKGVISNVAGDRNVILLTDARCLPGSEGGGIYSVKGDGVCLVGIIVAPLCWKTNEWVGLTLACAVSHILENISKAFGRTSQSVKRDLLALKLVDPIVTDLKRDPVPTKQLVAAVVLVDSGQVWGSGVLVNPKVVLTCRHVVRDASKVLVKIRHPTANKNHVATGHVVFATHETSPYDIAVVELEDPLLRIPEPVLASGYCTGEDVCVMGYGAFGERCGPSVTSGVLSVVISVGDAPVMLQTTCAVHGGSSGGPVFADNSGELLGIVASNTRDNSVGATYPHLNFSIPITVFREALQRYSQFGDLRGFQELNKVGNAVRDVWRLQRKPEKCLPSKL
ncbi:peroxisomal leader peptide-processing protease [Ascaphus truei]|uniref:peroxisomal leader peptide-processing protease n=1 Tax=Ascaphus truei TaxID=8439 RepID=UPI003F5908EC